MTLDRLPQSREISDESGNSGDDNDGDDSHSGDDDDGKCL